MDETNPYQSPTAQLQIDDVEQLAERGTRLGAVLIDGLIGLVVVTPVMWLGGYWTAVIDAA